MEIASDMAFASLIPEGAWFALWLMALAVALLLIASRFSRRLFGFAADDGDLPNRVSSVDGDVYDEQHPFHSNRER